jgi:formylglycine-generating enzyme required for sulfatase activity
VCRCEAESDAKFCERLGRTCGPATGTSCGAARTVASCGVCSTGSQCTPDGVCNVTTPVASAVGTTAAMTGDGLSNCGPAGNESCATSVLVTGGTYDRSAPGSWLQYPATVSNFRLDRYEATTGRFRRFVAAWRGGWRPAAGSGKHAHLFNGAGLAIADSPGTFESGWDSTWNAYVGAPGNRAEVPTGAGAGASEVDWAVNLRCDPNYATWTTTPATNEKRPQNCLSWYDAAAFCIWDGGFLPTEAEWQYAATGGAEGREYPWGGTRPGADTDRAIHGCFWPAGAGGTCSGVPNIAPVGSAPNGRGRWGHVDLSGSMFELVSDRVTSASGQGFTDRCTDCVQRVGGGGAISRGGSFAPFESSASFPLTLEEFLSARWRGYGASPLAVRYTDLGVRCARLP